MHYELTDLRLFFAIAEAQNLSAGASSLFMSASSASYRLKNLEKAMGTALFERTPKGMSLTPAGATAMKHVEKMLSLAEELNSEVSRFSGKDKINLRLVANSSSLNGFVVQSIGRYLTCNPKVNVQLDEMTSQHIAQTVEAGQAEVGVLASGSNLSGLEIVPYAADELIIVVPEGHPLDGSEPVLLADILGFDYVCMERTSSNFIFLNSTARQAGGMLNVRIHASGFNSVLELVSDGLGIAMVPKSVAASAIEDGQIIPVELAEPWAKRDLVIVTSERARADNDINSLIEFLLADISNPYRPVVHSSVD